MSLATDAPARPATGDRTAVTIAPGLYRRILRRETHSSRSGAAIVVLIVLALVAAYVGLEAVVAALGKPPLLFSPLDVLSSLGSAASGNSLAASAAIVIAAGIATGVVGIVLIVVALSPGRRGRHSVADPRVAVIIDDHVIAASLSHAARSASRLAPGQVTSWVARRSARLTLTPASGSTADEETVLRAASDELVSIGYEPTITADVRVNRNGRLGA